MIRTKKFIFGKKWSCTLTRQSIDNQNEWKEFWVKNTNVPSFYKYNITICDDPKFIWFRNAKVCTRTILESFTNLGLKLVAEQANGIYYPPEVYKDYYKFAFVRNPWDRLVSGWKNKIDVDKVYCKLNLDPFPHAQLRNFEQFVDYSCELDLNTCDKHFRLQSRLIDLNEVDFIGRFENFDDDFNQVLDTLKLFKTPIPHVNKSNRKPYHQYYSEQTKLKVKKIYQRDIQLFGYNF